MGTYRRFCFTLNNYTQQEYENITSHHGRFKYLIIGKEVGESGTPHLQGFCITEAPIRFSTLKGIIGQRAHVERAMGTSAQAADYCKKENDFEEFGTFPGRQGARSDLDEFKEWVAEQPTKPSERAIAREFPHLYLKYPKLTGLVDHLRPEVSFTDGTESLRGWQVDLESRISEDADDRSIFFVVDREGGKGKSWFVRYMLSKKPDDVQFLSVGKRDDLAFAIDPTKRIFMFDIPRGSMQYLQYAVLEKLKDRMVFSGKYHSTPKYLEHNCHVVVLCNEHPDENAMTHDRYIFIDN